MLGFDAAAFLEHANAAKGPPTDKLIVVADIRAGQSGRDLAIKLAGGWTVAMTRAGAGPAG